MYITNSLPTLHFTYFCYLPKLSQNKNVVVSIALKLFLQVFHVHRAANTYDLLSIVTEICSLIVFLQKFAFSPPSIYRYMEIKILIRRNKTCCNKSNEMDNLGYTFEGIYCGW